MSDANLQPTIDPDHVSEILCLGKLNVSMTGPFATITFTHGRPKPALLLDNGVIDLESVVRARIVTSVENLTALRDLLDRVLDELNSPGVGSGKPN